MNLNEKIRERLLNTFKNEAHEHIQLISNQLIKYENETDRNIKANLIEEIYRAAHSLKGAARAVGLSAIVELCQSIENVFSGFKKNELEEDHQLFDITLKGVKVISAYIDETDETNKLLMEDEIVKTTKLISDNYIIYLKQKEDVNEVQKEEEKCEEKGRELNEEVNTERIASEEKPETESDNKTIPEKTFERITESSILNQNKIADRIKVSIEKIENLLGQAEELLPNKQALKAQKDELTAIELLFETWRKKSAKNNLLITKLSNMMQSEVFDQETTLLLQELLKYIDGLEEMVNDIERLVTDLETSMTNNYNDFDNKLYQLNESVRSVLMLPFSALSDQFPMMVRDIASQLGKKINFRVTGDNIDIDKRVLDELKDPLVHLLRNAIDHGIEKVEERIKKGKEKVGNIHLAINLVEGNKVQIKISDDGRGINPKKIIDSAIKKKIRTKEELAAMSENEILNLIFESELSTAEVITDLSGRGLGMAIVKEKVDKLFGSIDIDSNVDSGTIITLTLPLSVATMRGLLVKVGNYRYYIKTSKLVAAIRVKKDTLNTFENKLCVKYGDKYIGLIYLANILNIKSELIGSNYTIVLCKNGAEDLGLIVDEILGEEEILIKPFNKQIKKIKFYEAGTIVADGSVIPVLNLKDIFKEASGGFESVKFKTSEREDTEKKNILVVDDSITSRLLLKEILENSGYNVKTCVDGKEAWTEFRKEGYDLVVSDVEMPRMDGFELTKLIKSSDKYAHIPVVLVTGLSKQEHIEKGIDSGASAYIVKSDFEQSNLLQTVERLLK